MCTVDLQATGFGPTEQVRGRANHITTDLVCAAWRRGPLTCRVIHKCDQQCCYPYCVLVQAISSQYCITRSPDGVVMPCGRTKFISIVLNLFFSSASKFCEKILEINRLSNKTRWQCDWVVSIREVRVIEACSVVTAARSGAVSASGAARSVAGCSTVAAAAASAGAGWRRSAHTSHRDDPSARDDRAHVSSITYGSFDTAEQTTYTIRVVLLLILL